MPITDVRRDGVQEDFATALDEICIELSTCYTRGVLMEFMEISLVAKLC